MPTQVHPDFESVVEGAFAATLSKQERFKQLINDIVATADEVNRDGRTPQNWALFKEAQRHLIYFVILNHNKIRVGHHE